MGDFDRIQQPGEKKSESKKVAMVLVLGAVLLGLLGFQMLKKGPEQAAAAPADSGGGASGGDAPAPAVDELTPVLQVALLQDPTAKYLHGEDNAHFPTATLRNPFRMSRDMYDALKPKEKPPEIVVRPATDTQPAQVVKLPPPPKGLQAADYKLNTIVVSSGSYLAMINGTLVHAGSTIGDAYIVEVRSNGVVMRHKDFADGPLTELKLN